ncbi:hypothetical protein PsYK624_032810 [Phanerochaete sordida]|uniref:Ribosome biogenesis protein NSA1 n=1 Tax=Phanerochaete sordida TaxID=48140 RepID=A0A9P3G1B9_9APHY|nr:hypothetical protein PsYK624_032810 [Phanerochaete sordida]
MPLFYAGDELGSVKSVRYSRDPENKQWKAESSVLVGDASAGRAKAIQKLAMHADEQNTLLAAFRADGSSSVLKLDAESSSASESSQWRESRLKDGQKFVGAAFTQTGTYSSTSNGALRLTKFTEDYTVPSHELAVLPMRLAEWRLSSNEETFAYAGDEVELSVWNTERAFSKEKPAPAESESKKRKRAEQLLPGEIWRAKNVSNDELNLRVPVRNTCLAYLQPAPNASQQHILVGTQLGDVRRYDTRAARRPVSNFKCIAKVGGIGAVENGTHEHQVFVSDHGCNLFALDLRNGQVSYGYKGLAGAVTALAPAPALLVSAAEDRFLRLHSTFAPPPRVGAQQEHKGEVLDKLYMKVTPTVVLWDGKPDAAAEAGEKREGDSEDEDEEDVWDQMEDVDSEDEGAKRKKSKSK